MSKYFIFAVLAALLLNGAIPAAKGAQPGSTAVWNVTFQWQGEASATTKQNTFNTDGTGSDGDSTPFTYTVAGNSISWTFTVFDKCVYTGTINGNTMSGTMSDPVTKFTGTWSAALPSVSIAWGAGTTDKTAGDVTPLNWRVKGAGGDQLGLGGTCVSNDDNNKVAMNLENASNTGTKARVSAAVTDNGGWTIGSAPATDTFVMQAQLGGNALATLTVAGQELTGTTTLARGADQALVLTVMTPTNTTHDAGVAKPILVTLTATPE